MKTMFLLSHTPIPRLLKRIQVASELDTTKLIYWDRDIKNDLKFTVPENADCESIKLKAPQGKPLKRSMLLIFFSFKSLKKMMKFKPKNLHVGNFDMLLIAYINKNVNVIYEVGDLPEIIFKKNIISKIYIKAEKRLLNKVNFLILTSPYFWDHYYSDITKEYKYQLIPNVPSVKITQGIESNNQNLNTNLTIGFIGSVRYEKQLKMLIDIVRYQKDIHLMIAGAGKSLEEIKRYASVSKNIIFTGAYDYKDIGDLYNQVDIVYGVYDTTKNNVKIALPNRLYESILFEKPLIASKKTELAKFVLENNIGYAVSDSNSEELKNLITYINKNKESLKELKNNCFEIKNNYIYEAYIPIIKSFYQ